MNVGTEKFLFIYFNGPTIRTDYIPGNLTFPLHIYDLHCICKCEHRSDLVRDLGLR